MNLTDAAEILLTHARSRLVRMFSAMPHDGSLVSVRDSIDLIEDLFVNHGEDFEDLAAQHAGVDATYPGNFGALVTQPLNLAMVRCLLLAMSEISETSNAKGFEATRQVMNFWLRHGPDICAAMHVIPVDLKM